MADTSVNHEAECWIVEHGLPEHFLGHRFKPGKLRLSWGGSFAFDAVSEDQAIVVAVSTSAALTATGKLATAKFQKLKTDALYLLHIEGECRKIMVFTELCMQVYFSAAATAGRFPPSIELVHIPLPPELQTKVLATRAMASKETSPLLSKNEA
mgnify:CR=1 FL=1